MSKSLRLIVCVYKIVSSDYVIKELYLENIKITTDFITKKLFFEILLQKNLEVDLIM